MKLKDIKKHSIKYEATFDDKFVYITPKPNRFISYGLEIVIGEHVFRCDIKPDKDVYELTGLPGKVTEARVI